MTIRLVLVDHHAICLYGLQQMLVAAGGYEMVACCANGHEALKAIEAHAPEILVVELRMPGMSGIELLKEIGIRKLNIRTVILTTEVTEAELLEVFRLEVRGIVLKEMAPRLLLQCLQKVHEGGQWLEHRAMQAAFQKALRRQDGHRQAQEELTQREIKLVCLVAEGLRNKEIATRLHITEGTVKTHLRNVYRKLNRQSRVALRRYAEERGLI
jgi:two-component system, NarL family, nitrate/nitrite response regulator NarL